MSGTQESTFFLSSSDPLLQKERDSWYPMPLSSPGWNICSLLVSACCSYCHYRGNSHLTLTNATR